MKQCIQCSADLLGKHQLKFCSRSCSATYSNLQKPRRTKTSARWHDCPQCGTLTGNVKFCSRECQSLFHGRATPGTPERKRQVQDRWNEANAKY